MNSSDEEMLGGWIGGSLDRLVRGRVSPEVSASVDWARPAGGASSVTIVKWRVQAEGSARLTGWVDASAGNPREVRRHGAPASTQ